MKRLLFALLLPWLTSVSQAQDTKGIITTFNVQWIQNQHVLGVNREAGHTTFIPYTSRADLMADARFKKAWLMPTSAMTLDLNGEWRFRYVPGSNQGPRELLPFGGGWEGASYNDERWPLIRVPLNWEMAGYSKPTYNNTGYPFRNEPPRAMDGYEEHGVEGNNATGFYRRTFDLPASWQDKRVFIHFDGVYSCAAVWVNGQFVGYGQGSNNDAEYDITAAVRPGRNQLAVRVYRWCDGSYLEGQDMWRLSGIHRDVYLVATPKVFVRDHVITVQNQSADGRSGQLSVALDIDNRDHLRGSKTFRLELLDAAGKVVASKEQKVSLKGTDACLTLTTDQLSDLTPWNAEEPYLYDVVISQLDGKREEMVFATKYGFRHIQLVNTETDKYVTINGSRIFFKGTNIHDAHPEYGRYVDVETMLRDITLMKQANLNTIRTSHYPRQPKMYAMFDAYGLYVMDEADLECHGNQGLTRDTAWTEAFVDRDVRMVQRDRNHPSVIFWSLGNENGEGQNMDSCYAAIRKLDARPIHCHGNESSSDMHSEMYTSVGGTHHNRNGWGGKPFFICEYAHAMGQAVGNLVDYWREIEQSNGIIGACIWDWVDQAVYDPQRLLRGDTLDAYGFHAWTGGYDFDSYVDDNPGRYNDKAFQGNYLNNGIITPDRAWTSKLTEVKKVYQWVEFRSPLTISPKGERRFTLRNKYPFQTIDNRYYIKGTYARDGHPVQDFRIDNLNVKPGENATISLPKLSPLGEPEGASEITLTLALCLREAQPWAPAGYAIADEQFVLQPRSEHLPAIQTEGQVTITENKVTGKDWEVEFNANGQLTSYVFHGRELLSAAPDYSDFRRIDNDAEGKQYEKNNDDGGDHRYDYAATGIETHTITHPLTMNEGKAMLTMEAKGWKTNYQTHYIVYPDGTIDMCVSFDPQRRGLRRLGIYFQLAPGFDEMEYYARGPWSNYKDRQTGSYLGRYRTTIDGMVEENIHPQAYGDHQDLRELVLTGSSPVCLRIQTEGPVAFSLSHFNELEWNQRLHYERLHWSDLAHHDETFAHFDLWQRGIGNNSCFSDSCLPHYETPYPGNNQGLDSLTYTLRFIPELK